MRKLLIAGLLAAAVAVSGTAYAEVQNIKVSGDIDIKGIIHRNYDLKEKINKSTTNDDNENFFLSTVHLQVDADLTDNVSASVRLLNQRKWDTHTAGDDQITLDNAYVVLKEFLYSPLTVIAGRQNLSYGTGFIVGNGLLADPEGVFGTGAIGREHSAFNAYDAFRFILDYSPITVEGLIAKINESNTAGDDTDLYGAIVNYKLDRWNAEVEPYWFYKKDEAAAVVLADADGVGGAANRSYENNEVHTVGLRTYFEPIENLRFSGEGAYQFGKLRDDAPVQERDREAWAANVYANYTWADVKWTPATGLGWTFYSGEESEDSADLSDASDDVDSWDVMFRGDFHTFIQDFLAGFDGTGLYATVDGNDTSANTNRHLLYFDVGASPMEDVTVWARYTHVRFDETPINGRDEHAGDEIDVKVLYDYTEDVQLNVFGGWFLPGDYYDGQSNSDLRSDEMAWTLGGGGSVKF